MGLLRNVITHKFAASNKWIFSLIVKQGTKVWK